MTTTHATHQPPLLVSEIILLNVIYLLPRSLLVPGAPCCMPGSVTVSLVRSPPLCRPWPAPRYLSPPGGFAHMWVPHYRSTAVSVPFAPLTCHLTGDTEAVCGSNRHLSLTSCPPFPCVSFSPPLVAAPTLSVFWFLMSSRVYVFAQ